MTGASGLVGGGTVSLRRKCDLVLAWLAQAYRDESRLGCHQRLSPENLDRPHDLAGVQGIERMTGRRRRMPTDGIRAEVIFVVYALARYHRRSLPRTGTALVGGTARRCRDMPDLRVVLNGIP